jgi:hypothetical protein
MTNSMNLNNGTVPDVKKSQIYVLRPLHKNNKHVSFK